jgi:hypothetical protein
MERSTDPPFPKFSVCFPRLGFRLGLENGGVGLYLRLGFLESADDGIYELCGPHRTVTIHP